MRRLLTTLVLASFAAGPGLRAHCLLSCAAVEHAAVPVGCHADAASGPAVALEHACAGDALAVALAVKRAGVSSPLVGIPIALAPVEFAPPPAVSPAFVLDLAAPSPPLHRFLIPLRI